MISITTNSGDIQLYKKYINQKLDKTLLEVIKEHLNCDPQICTKVEGKITNGSKNDLNINVKCFDIINTSQICIALIDELGEYFSIDIKYRFRGMVSYNLPVSEEQKNTTKKTKLLIARLNDRGIFNVRVYELEITNYKKIKSSSFRGVELS